ncbi:MAG: PEPxxWA-CTERM sorting domain-containing protein [Parasphingorhabdus sp.]|uniref:PEPxxWA-CTERM sorting domain-containing protein n=1 Tax=Parasphingorhabdus sp. TaxID=2709688 RepID=UPI0030038E6A
MRSISFTTAVVAAALVSAPAFAATTVETSPGFVITNNSSNSSTVNVAATGNVTGISVTLRGFVHTWVGDLIASLTHGGVTTQLFSRPGVPASFFGSGSDLVGTYSFSDGGGSLFQTFANQGNSAVAPGSYSPLEAFSAFNGLSANGDWTLSVSDNAVGDQGFLGAFTLNVNSVGAVPEPATWALLLLGFFGIGGMIRAKPRVARTTVSYS